MSFDELDQMIGEPVYCQRCVTNGNRHIVVGFLAVEDGRDGLTPAEYVTFDDPEHHPRYMPKLRVKPSFEDPVELRCRHCEKSCGEWKPKTIRKRLRRGVNTVA